MKVNLSVFMRKINIAIEISPLLTASGVGGDKSGVYRYMWGIISELIQKNVNLDRVILFTFNRHLQKNLRNLDVLNLINNKSYIFIDHVQIKEVNELEESTLWSYCRKTSLIRNIIVVIARVLRIRQYLEKTKENKKERVYTAHLLNELRKHNVDIVFHSETGFRYIPECKNIITIYDLTTVLFPELHQAETIHLHKRKFNFMTDYCDGVVCISESTKKDLIKYYPSVNNKKIVVIYPGVGEYFSQSKQNDDELFLEIQLHISKNRKNTIDENKYLLFYGTFEPRKNILYLAKAFNDLYAAKEIPVDMKLILVGGRGWGNIRDAVQNFLHENYLMQDKCPIILLEYLGDRYIHSIIKNAYAVVYPSLYEGFGLPILESMAIGTPVICSDNSSMPEVGGEAVTYFDPTRYEDMREKIKHFINSPELVEKHVKLGIEQSQKFRPKRTIEPIYPFFQSLLD